MKERVRKIALVAKADKPTTQRIVQQAVKLAVAPGLTPITDDDTARLAKLKLPARKNLTELSRLADLIMVFGGDGTMLHWARNTAGSGTPIFGVNIGGMGFLTATSGKDLAKAIKAVAAGEFTIEPRTLLSAKGQNSGGKFQLKAMNDIVISRGSAPRMIRVEVKVDGEVLTVYRCDGLVFSLHRLNRLLAGGRRRHRRAGSRGHLYYADLPAHAVQPRRNRQSAVNH